MTDETYTLIQTQKERRSMNSGARARKCGSKSKKCSLPSDHLTPAQKRKLNGPPEVVNLNRPMSYNDLKAVSPTLQFLYLDHLIHEFGARQQDIIAMLGASEVTCYKLFRSLPGKLAFKGRPRKPDPRWVTFMHGELPPPAPVEEPTEDPDILPAAAPEPEPEKVDPNPPQPITILSGSFTIHGTAADLIEALAKFIDTSEPLTYTLSFTK